jgi:hypothetical protein
MSKNIKQSMGKKPVCGKGTRVTAVKDLAKRFKKTRTRRG